ncbi:MAG TPA: YcxB family protein [Cyclobacteriaceae bacterium]|nr:YcxB family protein [Cyclobacteriaceae bacterium]HMV07828.1 YcxB family protein [Cyclobacteriaceae bacterium]HMV88096.1 YcxB family protein [Cyclobacteriaceae bacterium]HMW98962.1 YcxB family protein [Cyclobacteriaceae bacterium]HMX48404.1 YcxB family protein [Cyclobacteriaceae bacterium]
MIVKTKNYKLEKKIYIKLALQAVLKKQGWIAALGAFVLCLGYMIPGADTFWWFIGAGVGLGLYILFWWIQFYGVTQLEQGKMLFEKFSYEISSQQIVMKINAREGMPMKWDQIKSADIGKDYFVLFINKAQLIYLPFRIFNTDNERKFVGSVLKTKKLVK